MQVDIHEEKKILSVWLKREEQNDCDVLNKIKTICEECKARKYRVCVFRSGCADLSDMTLSLLQYNRKKLEQNRMENEAASSIKTMESPIVTFS